MCQLQNETSANNPTAAPQRSVNMYYMTKMQLRSENICLRPWAFERVPNKMIRGLDNALIYTSTKEACLSACLNEVSNYCSHRKITIGKAHKYQYFAIKQQSQQIEKKKIN